jgi:thioredoxin-related protein
MRNKLILSFLGVCLALTLNAQTLRPKVEQKKVYNEDINPIEQIDQAIVKSKSEGKFVICQVGGNWCPWCLRFADFITNDTTISKVIDENFVYIHVNYNPRKSEGEEKMLLAKKMLERLNNPARFGFPVFVVLDDEGKVIHIQDSSFLEEGQGYDQKKVLRFFKNWTPKVVKQSVIAKKD